MVKKILVVEDEVTILELLSEIFSDLEDCKVFYTRDGEETLRIARGDNPDIVLLVIQLLIINGYEVFKSIKSDSAITHSKVLMISGMVQDTDWQRVQNVGADVFIAKPFSLTALMEKIEELLSRKKPS